MDVAEEIELRVDDRSMSFNLRKLKKGVVYLVMWKGETWGIRREGKEVVFVKPS